MARLNIVSREVAGVEGKNPPDAVDVHRRRKFGVMDFASQNLVNRRRIRQYRRESLDLLQLAQGGCDVPELGDVLQGEIYSIGGGEQRCDNLDVL